MTREERIKKIKARIKAYRRGELDVCLAETLWDKERPLRRHVEAREQAIHWQAIRQGEKPHVRVAPRHIAPYFGDTLLGTLVSYIVAIYMVVIAISYL